MEAQQAEKTSLISTKVRGRKRVVLTAKSTDGRKKTDAVTVIVHTRPTETKAQVSGALIRAENHLWMVFPEGNSILKVNPTTQSVTEIPTCHKPMRLAINEGMLAVTCPSVDAIRLINTTTNESSDWVFATGSAPFGIISRDNDWWIALRGEGILQRWTDNQLGAEVVTGLGSDLRDISLSHDDTILAPRWRSNGDTATILRFSAHNLEPREPILLPKNESGDSDNTTNGVPNLLGEIRPSPDGQTLYVPMLHANVDRGAYLSGEIQTHETILRAVLARVSSEENTDDPNSREQFDERGRASSALSSPFGDTIYTLHPSSQHITILDAISFENIGAILNVGAMPRGMSLDEAGETLYVYAWLDRSLSAYDVRKPHIPSLIWRIGLVQNEPLSPTLLKGKRLFYNAQDTRITKSGYIACSNCHPNEEHDGQTWDFTDRGEGLRNTHTLKGVAHTGQIHWTGNFDEFQDFEHDFRDAFAGTGFLTDEDYAETSPLSEPKSGKSDDLDALAAFMMSLTDTPTSPFTDSANGAELLTTVGCDNCHSGPMGTDSDTSSALRHDVGTATDATGSRLNFAYDGFDTPTLNGIWATAPYLHDGSAETILEAIMAHDLPEVNALTPTEQQALVVHLLSR